MSLVLREFDRQTDFLHYRQLFLLSFPETKGTSVPTDPHYHWKFASLPAVPASYEFVALHEGRVVGYYAALPYRYFVQGRERLCGMVCDVMTHPEMRGQGVFSQIGRFSTTALGSKGVDFVSGYPIRPAVIPGHVKVGWTVAFREPVYARPLKVNTLVKNKPWAKLFIPVINLGLALCNFVVSRGVRKDYRVEILSREDFLRDPGYDEFFPKWALQQRNYLVKSRDFLAWRTGAPGTSYRFAKLSIDGKWVGLAISRSTTLQGIPTLAILDLMVLPEHVRGLKNLHAALRALARKEECEVVATMMSPYCASTHQLASSFYLRTSAVFSVILKALNSDMEREGFGSETDWHLMWIDSDDL